MNFSVTILGSSSAIPTIERNLSSQIISYGPELYMIDCGEGTQQQLNRFGIKTNRIEQIFISHMHGDHFYGLIGLLSTLSLQNRLKALTVYGPPELEKVIQLQLEVSHIQPSYPIHFIKVDPADYRLIFEDKNFYVYSIPLLHRIPATGFLFREKKKRRKIRKEFVEAVEVPVSAFNDIIAGKDFTGPDGKVYPNREITIDPPSPRAYAYCADTKYTDAIIPYLKNVDLLYHEATFMEEKAINAEERFHSTAKQAATIARKTGAGKLIIGHFSTRYKDLNPLLNEARKVFPETYLAEDGVTFDIPVS